MVSYAPEEFVAALSAEGDLPAPPISQFGMVKLAEDAESILLAPGTQCSDWVTVPTSAIEKIDYVGKAPCADHEHPLVWLRLKRPESDEGRAFADLLRATTTPTATTRALPASPPGTTPFPEAGGAVPSRPEGAQMVGDITGLGDAAATPALGAARPWWQPDPCTVHCYIANPPIYLQVRYLLEGLRRAGALTKTQCYDVVNSAPKFLNFLQVNGVEGAIARTIVELLVGYCGRCACDHAFE